MRIKEIEAYKSPYVSDDERAKSGEKIKKLIREEVDAVIRQGADDGERDEYNSDHVMCLHGQPDFRPLYTRYPATLVDEVLQENSSAH